MSGSGGAPASAADGGGGDREGTVSEEGALGGESTCRPRGSTGRTKWPRGAGWSWAPGPFLDSERADTPAVRRGSKGWSGSDSAGSRVAGAGQEGMKKTGSGRRGGGVWPVFASL